MSGVAVFGPLLQEASVVDELSLLDSNVAFSWILDGCSSRGGRPAVDTILARLWLPLAFRKAFKWRERAVTLQVGRQAQPGLDP